MIRCAVFDFDGTLVHSNAIKHQTFVEVVSAIPNGARLMLQVLERAEGRDRYWIFRAFAQALDGTADALELADRYTQLCEERISAAPEVAGATDSLEQLRQEGMLLFVNSATPQSALVVLARLRGLDSLLNGVYGAPASKHENLALILSSNGISPQDAVVVGDGESDRASAERCGCRFVAVQNEHNDFTRPPSFRIADLTGLLAVIAGFSQGDKLGADENSESDRKVYQ